MHDKATMRGAMIRKGWLMPKLNTPLCTLNFMEAVRMGEIWCPKREDIAHPVVVVTPPPQDILAEAIVHALKNGIATCAHGFNSAPLENLMQLLQKKKADTQWLLEVLNVLDENHRVFAPDYVYVKPRKPHAVKNQMIANHDSFFDGLPMMPSKKSKRVSTFRVSKTERQEQKVRDLE